MTGPGALASVRSARPGTAVYTPEGNLVGFTDGTGGIITASTPVADPSYSKADSTGKVDLSGKLSIPTSPADAAREADALLRDRRTRADGVHEQKHTITPAWQHANVASDGGLNRTAISRLLRSIGVADHFKISPDGRNVVPYNGGIEVAFNSSPADGSIELTFRWRD